MASPEDRLRELGYELPPVPQPAGSYVPATRAGTLVFTAGQVPFRGGEPAKTGKVGDAVSAEEAYAAARLCALNALAAAAAAGAERVILTVGGSATTDGGAGALEALDEAGVQPTLEVLCDVRAPWEAAAATFGPQKGAGPEAVRELEQRLERLARQAPRDPRGVPMTGAAGGLAGGLWAHRGAKLLPGAAFVLDALDFNAHMREARFVVTGEGAIDSGTLQGKAAGEVATRCRQSGVACHAVVGVRELEPFEARILDLSTVIEATSAEELEDAGRRLATAE